MDYRLLFEEANKEVEERFELASGRIRELAFGDICQKLSEGFQEYFLRNHRRQITENNWKQALVPEGAIVIDNHNGTAPGLILEDHGKIRRRNFGQRTGCQRTGFCWRNGIEDYIKMLQGKHTKAALPIRIMLQ